MYRLRSRDVEQLRTDTLLVWICRPDHNHQNWRLGFYSTSCDEVRRWQRTIMELDNKVVLRPFQQGCIPVDHEKWHQGCQEQFPFYYCPGVAHTFEMLIGCSEYALAFPAAQLEELVELGDGALGLLLSVVPQIQAKVSSLY